MTDCLNESEKEDSKEKKKRALEDLLSEKENNRGPAVKVHITEKNFFNAVHITKQEFLDYLYSLNDEETAALEFLFKRMWQRGRIDSTPYLRKDWKGRYYVNCSYPLPVGNQYFPVILTPELFQLLVIYQCGIYVCQTTLEAVYEEALK